MAKRAGHLGFIQRDGEESEKGKKAEVEQGGMLDPVSGSSGGRTVQSLSARW